jgi:hypothetical protein
MKVEGPFVLPVAASINITNENIEPANSLPPQKGEEDSAQKRRVSIWCCSKEAFLGTLITI